MGRQFIPSSEPAIFLTSTQFSSPSSRCVEFRPREIRCTKLNSVGPELAATGLLRAAVDVTGFGLLGHLGAMCRASGAGAEIAADAVPVISTEVFQLIAAGCVPGGSRDNLAFANECTEWDGATPAKKAVLTDAQTSGGLLLSVPRRNLDAVMKRLKSHHALCAAVIGQIVRSNKPKIRVMA
jgi:selenide, water dikinase